LSWWSGVCDELAGTPKADVYLAALWARDDEPIPHQADIAKLQEIKHQPGGQPPGEMCEEGQFDDVHPEMRRLSNC
jgi:hypothetical protein